MATGFEFPYTSHVVFTSLLQRTFTFKGGEAEALKRLQHYLWGTDAVATYFDTRNGVFMQSYAFTPLLQARGPRWAAGHVLNCRADAGVL